MSDSDGRRVLSRRLTKRRFPRREPICRQGKQPLIWCLFSTIRGDAPRLASYHKRSHAKFYRRWPGERTTITLSVRVLALPSSFGEVAIHYSTREEKRIDVQERFRDFCHSSGDRGWNGSVAKSLNGGAGLAIMHRLRRPTNRIAALDAIWHGPSVGLCVSCA